MYITVQEEAWQMTEREDTAPVERQPSEDVDDLIFQAGPGWLASDR